MREGRKGDEEDSQRPSEQAKISHSSSPIANQHSPDSQTRKSGT